MMEYQSLLQCADSGEHPPFVVPDLLPIAQVESAGAPESSLACIAAWIRNYLAQPHPDLGRQGLVCPFIPSSLRTNSIWMSEVSDPQLSFDSIVAIIMAYRDRFLEQEPVDGPGAQQKAFVIVFPTLANAGVEGARLVDKVQFALKKQFVALGLMLGEFHSQNESPGLRNENFRPLRSPIPLLAIRHMVDSDFPFMVSDVYSTTERAAFLREYLRRLGGSLKPTKFDQILDRLITEELALRSGIGAIAAAPATCPAGAMVHGERVGSTQTMRGQS